MQQCISGSLVLDISPLGAGNTNVANELLLLKSIELVLFKTIMFIDP
jgi:hypothetical protein